GFYFYSDDGGNTYGWYIDNVLIDGLVPTLLASYDTKIGDSWIELRWRLSEVGYEAQHRITRECVSDGMTTEFALENEFERRLSYAFRDDTVLPGKVYRYTVAVADEDGYQILFVTGEVAATAVESALHQNHPNPFNPVTTISYVVGNTELVDLKVYDTSGALVKALHHGVQTPGHYDVVWDGYNENGHRVASGIYFYRATIGKFSQTRKMVLLK
ncbi:MAG: T9SS type A sorting domain-containing protein, partial [Candidatus Krumholzibacteria bacterium]|nr:T9SS type A sorting domain-containing protein [Candidatus Krumholzibacteria bacterium]